MSWACVLICLEGVNLICIGSHILQEKVGLHCDKRNQNSNPILNHINTALLYPRSTVVGQLTCLMAVWVGYCSDGSTDAWLQLYLPVWILGCQISDFPVCYILLFVHYTCFFLLLFSLINADFCVAGCLIAYGAVLGKVSPVQLMVLTLFGITLFAVEEYIILNLIHVSWNINIVLYSAASIK